MTHKLQPNQIGFFNAITGQVVTPAEWQLELKPGNYYLIERPDIGVMDRSGQVSQRDTGPTVYGRIETGDDTPSFGYFWVRGFSRWCPSGELGLMNICEPTRRITRAEFEAARAAGWPQEPPAVEGREEQWASRITSWS